MKYRLANITLTLDVVSNVDYSKIEAEVEKIRSNLAKIPDKVTIDIQFDASGNAVSGIKNLRREIRELTSAAANAGRSTSKSLETAQKNAAAAYTSGQRALDKYRKMLDTAPNGAKDKYINLADSTNALRELRESGTATADELATATNKVTLATKELSAAFVDQGILEKSTKAATDEAAKSLKSLETAQKNAAAAYTSGRNALSEYYDRRDALQNKSDVSDADKNAYNNLSTAVSALKALRDNGVDDANALTKATNDVTLAVKNLSAAFAEQDIERKRTDSTVKTYREAANVLVTAEKNLKNWSSMENSAGEIGQKYAAFRDNVVALRDLMKSSDGTAEHANKVAEAIQNVVRSMSEASAIGPKTSNLKTQIVELTRHYGTMLSGIQGIQLAIRGVRKLAKEAIAIDDSMTQLRVVTGGSDREFEQYSNDVAISAQKIGSSITDVIDATTVFARLGYTLKESSKLAELTTMLQRVGDINASDAQASLTSIIKAFDVDVSDMESVMDKLVTVGNGFPISVSEIATGMMNASSALAAAGNSFDKSVALLAAANTTLQDASKASTGLRTITARIRKTDSELNDLGEAMTESAYEDLVGALTKYNVALRDANGEYRDTYDIMHDIAAVWDEMNSSEQAALAELAAGNRQQTVFYSIIKNFDSVAAASMEAMGHADNAMQNAYGQWQNSITAHIETFKAAFEGLSKDFISSDMLKGLIDAGTFFINIADSVVKLNDNLGKTTLTIGSIVAIIKSIKSIS